MQNGMSGDRGPRDGTGSNALQLRSKTASTSVGLALRTRHAAELQARKPALALIEVHSENYLGGGAPRALLRRVRTDYAVSLHGVGMCLGGVDALDTRYLAALKGLADEIEPQLISDHACFASHAGRNVHDLLPLPYTEEALEHLIPRIHAAQERLSRRLLLENPSAYIRYPHETLREYEFLAAASRRTGCGLLVDVNNVYVSSQNLGFDPLEYLGGLPVEAVSELHLAGHVDVDGLLIDTHGARVHAEVWELFRSAVQRFPCAVAVVEWDTDLPPLDTLLGEVDRAGQVMAQAFTSPACMRAGSNHAVSG